MGEREEMSAPSEGSEDDQDDQDSLEEDEDDLGAADAVNEAMRQRESDPSPDGFEDVEEDEL